jgi:hypothetical protein
MKLSFIKASDQREGMEGRVHSAVIEAVTAICHMYVFQSREGGGGGFDEDVLSSVHQAFIYVKTATKKTKLYS